LCQALDLSLRKVGFFPETSSLSQSQCPILSSDQIYMPSSSRLTPGAQVDTLPHPRRPHAISINEPARAHHEFLRRSQPAGCRALLRRTRRCTNKQSLAMDTNPLWTCQHIRLKQCREGAMLYTVNDTYIGRALDKYGEISRDEVLFLQQLTRPGMTVLEVGANIGVFTVPLARFVHPGGRVIALDPQRIINQ